MVQLMQWGYDYLGAAIKRLVVLWLHVVPHIGGLISDRDPAARSGDWKEIQNKSRMICIVCWNRFL